ncbi:hypothetical protein ACO2WH_27400, partial [Escherichia coli]|uniref:hypothetical protein n=1 Tax=Escherichia coli TaxID=562 RepID=UPI003C03CD26
MELVYIGDLVISVIDSLRLFALCVGCVVLNVLIFGLFFLNYLVVSFDFLFFYNCVMVIRMGVLF